MSTPADWLRRHAARLITLDPDAPFDDLEPIARAVAGARVVAVGESAHFVREFTLLRQRLLRFLNERCGFDIFAFEFGFSEGFAVDRWVRSPDQRIGLTEVSETAAAWGAGNLMRYLRRYNGTAIRPVRFAGIDIPEAGGTLVPALTPAADYLREVDPDLAPLVETAIQTSARFAGKSAAFAAPAWAKLDASEQNALTAALTRLVLRVRALEPLYVARSNQEQYNIALWRLEGALRTDYMFRAMAGLFAGAGLSGDLSIRDLYMAESVRWHLKHSEPGTRMILAAHNNHIQKTPVQYGGRIASLPMGQYLDRMFGSDYVALAATTLADHIPEMYLDENAAAGFRIADTPLGPPEPGSIEAALAEAELGHAVSFADLRSLPRDAALLPGLDRIRAQSTYMHTHVLDAFDGVLAIPTATMEEDLEI